MVVVLGAALLVDAAHAAGSGRGQASAGSDQDTSLQAGINRLARRYGVELLYSSELVRDRAAPAIQTAHSFEEALTAILAGSGLSFRRSPDGAYLLVRAPETPTSYSALTRSRPVEAATIVVTARRRSELLSDVPLSLAAFEARQIDEIGARNIEELIAFAPGAFFTEHGLLRPGRVDTTVRFRGMSVNTGNPQEQVASVFIDGIPVSSGLQSVGYGNIERVEVINGPQSAVFGRSTFGGAINIITRKPAWEPSGRIQLTAETNGDGEIRGSIEGPIVPEMVAVRVFGRAMRARGDYRNPAEPGRRLGRLATDMLGASVRLSVGDLDASGRLQYAYDHDGPPAAWGVGVFEANCGPFGTGTRRTVCGDLPAAADARLGQNVGDANAVAETLRKNAGPDGFLTRVPSRYGLERKVWRGSLGMSLALPSANMIVETLAGFNRERRYLLVDGDLSPDPVLDVFYPMRSNDHSLEARIRTRTNTPLKWSFGASHYAQDYRETVAGIYKAFANPKNYDPPCAVAPINCNAAAQKQPSPAGDLYLGNNPYFLGRVKTRAVFGSAELKLTPYVDIALEGRGEWDEVDAGRSLAGNDLEKTFPNFLYRAVVSGRPSDAISVYASVSKGNLPGGFNINVIDAPPITKERLNAAGARDTLPQQTLRNVEGGVRLNGGSLSLRLSGYYMRWLNQRIRRSFFNPETNLVISYLDGEGSSNLSGFEFQGTWSPRPWFRIDSTANLATARYRRQFSVIALRVLGDNDVSGNRLPSFPKYSGTASVTVTGRAWSDVSWFARGDAIYRGRIFADELNLTTVPDTLLANLRMGLASEALGVELFVTNLFQDRSPRFAAQQSDMSAYVPAFDLTNPGFVVSAPPARRVGMRVSVAF